jgi:protein O-GlcNAc transferase
MSTEAAQGLLLRASAHFHAREYAQSEGLCRQLLQAAPRDVDALVMLGRVHAQLGRPALAIALITRALNSQPDHAEALYHLGLTHVVIRGLPTARACFSEAVRLDPGNAKFRCALGAAHLQLGDLTTAAECFWHALAIDPAFTSARVNLGLIELQAGRYSAAAETFRRALATRADDVHAHANLGMALLALGDYEAAVARLRRALDIDPEQAYVRSNLLFALQHGSGNKPAVLLAEARQWERWHATASRQTGRREAEPDRRLRIGYVSADFRQHSVAHLIEPVLGAHDRSHFEIFCYSNSAVADDVTARLRGLADHWSTITGLGDADAAALIERDQIDLLVDLSGHTAGHRLELFSLKPAPVQASWLGYSGTTGLRAIDYILVDDIVSPPGQERFYTEQLRPLPGAYLTYQPPPAPEISRNPFLATGYVTFGCFNNPSKLTPSVVSVWSRILHAVPNARLVLKGRQFDDPAATHHWAMLFADADLGRDRVVFRGESTHWELLELYGTIDIALDPFPYNGCVTSLEALWMGVPVVALLGDHFVSRMSASVLARAGLSDLVANSADDYVAIASRLASDSQRLTRLRGSLRERMQRSLCEGVSFTRRLEQAYRSMWHTWCASQTLVEK